MTEIKPIGTVLKTDRDGFIVSQSSKDKIVDPWRQVVLELVQISQRILGETLHSVYVRGSVSQGTAIEGISDLDMIIVVRQPLSDESQQMLDIKRRELQQQYPFCTKIETGTHMLDELLSGQDRSAAILKIYAANVYGQDLIAILPPVKPGSAIMLHGFGFNRAIKRRLQRIEAGDLVFDQAWCAWMMKRILRSGGELIMQREQVFVRDLYPCYRLFSKYYPAEEPQMQQALEYALNPTANLAEVSELTGEFADWLEMEIERVYGRR